VQALSPDDLPEGVLLALVEEVKSKARLLVDLLQSIPIVVLGDTKGAAMQRGMLQAGAQSDQAELKTIAAMPVSDLQSAVALAFWCCRERVMDQHYAHQGPYGPWTPQGCGKEAVKVPSAGAFAAAQLHRYRRAPNVAAMWRPAAVLRINGYRLPGLSEREERFTRWALGVHTGCCGKPHLHQAEDVELVSQLVRVGALELAQDD